MDGRVEALRLWDALNAQRARYENAVSELNAAKIPLDEVLGIQNDLRRYFCLRCAGFLERVTFEVLSQYLRSNSSGPVHSFATSFFDRAPNLKANAFEQLIARFGATKSDSFSQFLTIDRRGSLNTLLEVRNLVAHGGEIGGAKLAPDGHYEICRDIYEWLVSEFL